MELYTALDGEAPKAVQDLDIGSMTFWELLQAYDERFVTRSGSDLAEAEFYAAKQLPDESILAWHARARELFLRAYPGHITEGELGRHLRKVFIFGLSSRRITEFVWDSRPQSYTACLDLAQDKHATVAMLQQQRKESSGIHNLQTPQTRNPSAVSPTLGPCHGCGQMGHLIRDCPQRNRQAQQVQRMGAPRRRPPQQRKGQNKASSRVGALIPSSDGNTTPEESSMPTKGNEKGSE